jgi:KDO2-lipid IV(A) lauroyltransferase
MGNKDTFPGYSLLLPRYWPTWLGILFLRLSVFLPFGWQQALGRTMGRLAMRFATKRRRIAETNLRLCFPEWDDAKRQAVLQEHFESLGAAVFEMPLSWWGSARRLRGLAHVQGLEHLQQALEHGRGVILLSAHFTSLEIGGRLLSLYAPFHPMYRSHDNPVIEYVMAGNRRKHCEKAIPRDSVREMIRSLKGNHAIWYAPDQNTQRKASVFVGFFGQMASTNSGTARLARLTGALVIPFHAVRREQGDGYDLALEPPLEDFPVGDLEADTQRINDLIEGWVRRSPAHYLWIHRRFRTRPNRDDPPLYD